MRVREASSRDGRDGTKGPRGPQAASAPARDEFCMHRGAPSLGAPDRNALSGRERPVFDLWHHGCTYRAFVEYHWAELGLTILMLVLVAGALTVSDPLAFRRWNRRLRRL